MSLRKRREPVSVEDCGGVDGGLVEEDAVDEFGGGVVGVCCDGGTFVVDGVDDGIVIIGVIEEF